MRWHRNIVKESLIFRTYKRGIPAVNRELFFFLLLSFLFVGWSRNITQRNGAICALNSREGGDGVVDNGDYGVFGQE